MSAWSVKCHIFNAFVLIFEMYGIFEIMKTTTNSKLMNTLLSILVFMSAGALYAQSDTIPPVISLIGPDTVWIELDDTYTDLGASANDNKDGDISALMTMSTDLDVKTPGVYTLTYNVKDNDGNSAKPAIRIIVVRNDLTKPVIILNPGNPGCIELSCHNPPYVDPGASATDNRAPFNLRSAIVVSGFVDTRKIGIYTLSYDVQDVSGNKAITQTRQVCVESNKPHGFKLTAENGTYRASTDESMEFVRTSYKWYLDGKYLSTYDNNPELIIYPENKKEMQLCMEEKFCDDTTPHKFCLIFGDTVQAPLSGIVFLDNDQNCSYDSADDRLNYVAVRIFDSSSRNIGVSYSSDGNFEFNVDNGIYNVRTDIEETPLISNCPYPGSDTLIELKPGQLLAKDIRFPLICKTGYDIGVIHAPVRTIAVPGRPFLVDPHIGNLNIMYRGNCAASQSGFIRIRVEGKAYYSGSETNAIMPDSVNGNEFVYVVSDFSTFRKDGIRLRFITDTTANIGDTIKVYLRVSPDLNDYNPKNNNVIHKILVRNSLDPNMKEVYPIDVEPGYDDWINYTVHFQNTGNSPAYKVRITDTLDAGLEPGSFQFLSSSHDARVGLKDRAMVFYFADIMLPDSNSDEKNSHGYVRYRVKPVKNLPEGSKIYNTAYIFFDYNKPVITNTTVNSFVRFPVSGISKPALDLSFSLFPNPSSGLFTALCSDLHSDDAIIEVFDIFGVLLYSGKYEAGGIQIDLRPYANGLYFCKLKSGETVINRTIIKQ